MAKPGYDGWRPEHAHVSTSGRAAIRADHAAWRTVREIAERCSRTEKTVRRVLDLVPAEDRTHLRYLFDFRRERTEVERAVDRGLCALTPGYRRVVEMAEAEYERRRRRSESLSVTPEATEESHRGSG